jgi:putative aldouronate transport system substrate-binding protein
MKKIRKGFMLVLAGILTLSVLLTACGNGGANSTEATESSAAGGQTGTAAGGAEKLEPVKLTMIIPGVPQADQALVNDAVSKYLADSLNVTLDLQVIDWSAWSDKNNLIIASGEECDILFAANWCGFVTNASKGAFLELSDLLKNDAAGITGSNYTWIFEAGKVGGKLYGVPSYQQSAQARGFYVRKDLAEKYGFTVKDVNTFDDMEAMFKVIKEKEPGITPWHGTAGHLLSWMGPWDEQGDSVTVIDCTSQDPKWVNFFETDWYKKSMETARKWYLAGYTNKDIATTKEKDDTGMNEGTIFAFADPCNIEIGGYNYPVKMCRISEPVLSTGTVQGALFTIPRQAKNPDRAMMLIDRMHTDKTLDNMLVYGIEGTHYVLNDGDIAADAPGVDPAARKYRGQAWIFGNETLVYPSTEEDPKLPQVIEKFNQTAIQSPALGFVYDPSNMKNEIAALENVKLEFDSVISSGVTDAVADGSYQKFLDKLKAAGIERLLEDKNAQLQEWLKQQK